MVLSIASDISSPAEGVRQIDVRRDLRAIAELISNTFANELDVRGQASLRELRSLSRLGPLLFLMVPPSGELGGFLQGFVWEADGEVVGNITIQQADYDGSRWMIANEAVRPDYRKRGIAGALMQAALTHIKESRGEWTVLQVDDTNDVARRLYQHLGFRDVLTATSLRCSQLSPIPNTILPADTNLKRLHDSDWSAVNHLLHRSLPESARWLNPTRVHNYRRNSDSQIILRWGHFIGLSQRERLGIYCGSDLMGVLDLWTRPRGEHEIDILMHPDVREDWTAPLLHHGLQQLQRYPHQPIAATFYNYQPQAIVALQTLGFRTTRVLTTMRKRNSRRKPDIFVDDTTIMEVNHANI